MFSFRFFLSASILLGLLGCGSDESQNLSAMDSDTPEMQTCRMAAQSMLDLARQAVNDTSSRPERRESRRILMEGWVARLADGENPCDVYADIGQASNTF